MKKDIRKTLKLAGILFLVLCAFQVFAFAMIIYSVQTGISKINYSWFNYAYNGVKIALSLVTGIIYLVLQGKKQEDIFKQNKLIFSLTIVNILNSFAGWVISFWIQIAVEQAKRLNFSFINPFESFNNQTEKFNVEDYENNLIMNDSDYEILHTETLTTRLEELNRLRSKNLITQEEYSRLRQEAIDKFLN